MKQRAISLVLLLGFAVPAIAKTHDDIFNVPCKLLWPAVKDTLRNSGKYGIIGIDNGEMTASYNIGGFLGGKRINSLVLNSVSANSCDMRVQTAYSGIIHNDAGDFRKRVEESLSRQPQGASAAADPNSSAPIAEKAGQ